MLIKGWLVADLNVIHINGFNKMIDDPIIPNKIMILCYRFKSDVIILVLYITYVFSNFALQVEK
jgi:hypothetical protein